MQESEDHLDGRAFAGSVGSKESKDFVSTNLKVDAVDGPRLRSLPEVCKNLGQADRFNNRFSDRGSPRHAHIRRLEIRHHSPAPSRPKPPVASLFKRRPAWPMLICREPSCQALPSIPPIIDS